MCAASCGGRRAPNKGKMAQKAPAADLCVLHRRIKGMPLCQTRGKTGLPTLETDQDRERYRVKVALQTDAQTGLISNAPLWLPT
jgi:hypothetical protein